MNSQGNLLWFRRSAELSTLVVFDLETTGLFPAHDEIIQIAAVKVSDGEIRSSDTFASYVKPTSPISSFITQYTGITNADVKRAPGAKEALIAFSEFCSTGTLVAHNGHTFDMKFLSATCHRERCPTRRVHYFDAMHASWQLWGRQRGVSHSLDHVKDRLRISTRGLRRHDARGDVEILARCLLALMHRLDHERNTYSIKLYDGVLPKLT
jgi:DNA polymerase III epsilon subunit family exonuclease